MKVALLLVLFFSGLTPLVFSQTIVNGSFEEWPDSCSFNNPPVGWSNFSNDTNGPDQRGIYCYGNITPIDGDHYMGLFGCAGSAIVREGAKQEITDLTIGDYYTISFYTIACDYTSYAVELEVYAYIDSVPVFQSDFLVKNEPWKHYQFSFQATDTSADLAFMTTDWGNYCSIASVGIDHVTIHQGVGISEQKQIGFELFPNPASDKLYIKSLEEFTTPIQILDVRGNILLERTTYDNELDISSLESGIYFLRLKNQPSRAQRFVKR